MSVMADPNKNNNNSGRPATLKRDSEERCVCLNRSFDVARVASLCTSCILQSGDTKTNMKVVMSVCGFPSSKYTPADDSVADNVLVSAARPTTVWGYSAGVVSDAPAVRKRGFAFPFPIGVAVGGALMAGAVFL
ncbi:hypothetical protein C2857_002878 [Epichloe festucae Fl1]|uniref:Uncharacterized protein n=1 Tax=Epichloe festucae (strain Fl1) TaxID=877507 RepID=A0A7S9KUL7_EPIFF|nr:hypothetical protein C2857_002878 [Epichloe festucae Fl1]